MDPVCHTLAGAAIGEAGLKKRTPLGMATLMLAANAPDVDALVWATDALHVHVRRGWTHGPVGLAVLPLLLAALILAYDRGVRQRRATPPPPVSWSGLLLLAYVGALSHPFLDYLNSYGVRWLMPFSERWHYGDALYIIDPWMYLFLGGAVAGARWAARRGRVVPERPARVGLGLAAIYVSLMLVSNLAARSVVRAGLDRAGMPADTRFMVTPVFANPLHREVLIDTGDRYEKGYVWFTPRPRFRPAGFGITVNREDPAARAAAATVLGRQFLGWSRFPFFIVDRAGGRTLVHVADARYVTVGGQGWARVSIPVE